MTPQQPFSEYHHTSSHITLSLYRRKYQVNTMKSSNSSLCHLLITLDLPWLFKSTNLHFGWVQASITSWSNFCHSNCLNSAITPSTSSLMLPDPPDLTNVPLDYLNLSQFFSKMHFHHIDHSIVPSISSPELRCPPANSKSWHCQKSRPWRHSGLMTSWPHSTLVLSSRSRVFLCWKEGRKPSSVYWLLDVKRRSN